MRIEEDTKLDYSDVLIRPKRSSLTSRKEVDLTREYTFKYSGTYNGVPIMAANMDSVGTFEMADALEKHNLFTCIHKHYTFDQWFEWLSNNKDLPPRVPPSNVAISTGTSQEDLEKVDKILAYRDIPYLCVDVANGYTQQFVDTIKRLRDKYHYQTIIAGNVVTAEMTEELILSGADIVKVGIGPGSVCTTRKVAGVGYPQLSAVIECADAAHGLRGHIIADGGCTSPGDVAKAFGAGADFVMLGSMLAGHAEGGGTVVSEWHYTTQVHQWAGPAPVDVERKYVHFYGMSSKTAQERHNGGLKEYRASEGRTAKIPYRGPVDNTVRETLGGLRSACTYVGASTLKELPKRTTFVRVSGQKQYNTIYEEQTIGF